MRHLLICITAWSLGLSGCAISHSSPRPSWETGFWLWQGRHAIPQWKGDPLDVIFLQVGTMGPRWPNRPYWVGTYPEILDNLPPAREYWLVFRYEVPGIPDPRIAPDIAQAVAGLRLAGQRQQLPIAGIQLDIDCGTEERDTVASRERQLQDEQEEYWRAHLILRDVVHEAGRTALGRRAAALELECLRRINTDRFGRRSEIRAANLQISKWLQDR